MRSREEYWIRNEKGAERVVWPFDQSHPERCIQDQDGDWPRISIITPTFNQGKYIEATILSILNQKYHNFQYIIVDNCSTDETCEVLDRYRHCIDHLIIEADSGQSNALNKGFALADGEILTWLNSDDMLAPDALFQVATAFRSERKPDIVAGSLLYMVDGRILYEHITSAPSGPLDATDLLDVHNRWLQGKYFYQPEVFFSRSIFAKAGDTIDESLFYSMDFDLWFRLARAGATMEVIGAPVAIFRGHPEQKTSSPDKYMPELLRHAGELGVKHGLQCPRAAHATRTMRLAFLCDVPEGGAAIAQKRLSDIATASGHEVELIHLLTRWSAERPDADVTGLYHRLKAFEPDTVIVGNLHGVGNASSVLEMVAVNFQSFFYTHDLWLVTGRCAYNKGCEKLLSLCDERCPTYLEYPQAEPGSIAKLHRSRLKLQSLHDFQVITNSRWMTDTVQRVWKAHGISESPAGKLTTVTPPCDVQAFLKLDRNAARKALHIPIETDVIVCSANNFADPRKGYFYLVDAVRALAHRGRLPLILFAGWADEAICSAVASFGNCIFLGHVAPISIPYVYAAADVLLSASLDEAFGMAYVEAAAAGAQSVTFRSGGVADAIGDGISGVLIDDLTGEALADAVNGVLKRKHRGEPIARAARLWAAANHSDIAVLRRFHEALMRREPYRSFAPQRTQIHRPFALADISGGLKKPINVFPLYTRRTTLAEAGAIEYAIWPETHEPDYAVARFRFTGKRPGESRSLDTEYFYDFKLVQICERICIDLRPHECIPPIYSRAFVERGIPFRSDDWGPTLFIEIGNDVELNLLRSMLPRESFDRFLLLLAFFCQAAENVSISGNAEAVLEAAGFATPFSVAVDRVKKWAESADEIAAMDAPLLS